MCLASSFMLAQSASPTALPHTDDQAGNRPRTSSTSNTAAAAQPAVVDYKTLEVIHSQEAGYPRAAKRAGIQGEVVVRVAVSETGNIEDAEVVSGDPLLADAAIKAAKKIKFKPLVRDGKPVKVATTIPFDFYFPKQLVPAKEAKVEPPRSPVPEDLKSTDAAKRVNLAANVTSGMLIRNIVPVYPKEAKRNHIQGKVVLRAVIGKDGRIKELKAVSGPEELIPPSIGAVQQWLYKPYLLFGEPVEVDTQVTVTFALGR
jgi:TonB family protein